MIEENKPEVFAREHNLLVPSKTKMQRRICVSVPMTGLVRSEWVLARYGQIIPVNWSNGELIQWFDSFSPFQYAVDHARNVAVNHVVTSGFEWLLFIDHDVILPHDTYVKMNEYIANGRYPVVCGLYAAKANPAEPLIFRGRGNSWFRGWKKGDVVEVDGVPMGCTLISVKLLAAMWEESEKYFVNNLEVRKVFHTPRENVWLESGAVEGISGTEDLWWCDRVIKEGWLKKTGFDHVADNPFPFLIDTNIWCGHITNEGRIYWPPELK